MTRDPRVNYPAADPQMKDMIWGRRPTSEGSGSPRRRRKIPASKTSREAGHLPRELTSFIGRQEQIDEVSQVLRTAGLMTLVGVGGVGKTRLALRAAAVQAHYAHGAWVVELAHLNDPAQVGSAVAHALGVHARPAWT